MGASDAGHVFSMDEVISRFASCKGRTLGEIDETGVFAGRPKNKGVAGAVIEQSVLGYPPDSCQRPDIVIDGVPHEVKTTGLIFGDKKKGECEAKTSVPLGRKDLERLEAKEPMSITAVSVDAIWKESFSNSVFWHKLEHLLIAYYLYNGGSSTKVSDPLEYAGFPFIDYEIHEWSDDDRAVLESDWAIVRDFVALVHEEELDPDVEYPKISHELNRKLLYTDTSPKWPNKPRWRLKRSTVTSMVKEHFSKELERLPVLLTSYEDIERVCRDIRVDFAGSTVETIARELGYEGKLTGKSVNEGLVVRMFGGKAKKLSKVDAFAKAGIGCKTIVLANGEARLSEDVKFARIDFEEAMDPEALWEGSNAQESFSQRILCAVFEEPSREAPLALNVFRGFKWIALDDEALVEACDVWEEVRRLIFSGELRDVPQLKKDGTPKKNKKTGLISTAPNWPKARDATVVFVRGDGRDSSKKPLEINGISMYHQYFWLKKQWVAAQLLSENYL